MLNQPGAGNGTEKLANELPRAKGASAKLFADVFAASPRLMLLRSLGKAQRLDRLVATEAWSDAALELLSLEAPNWSLQRLCLDDGEWLCTLTRFPDVPDWLDDSVEVRHPTMALAVLSAVVDLRLRATSSLPAATPQLLGATADCADYR
jgi:hypothetical protein